MMAMMTGRRRLYALALYATRPAGGESEDYEHEVYLRVALAVAEDAEDARLKTSERLFELCPPAQGWLNHHVTLNHVPANSMREALAALGDEEPERVEDDGDEAEWPELLM